MVRAPREKSRNGSSGAPTMKRFLVACSMALATMAVSNQRASAWHKCSFNIGLNIACEGAENNLLWGLYRNGPHPFAQAQGGYGGGGYGGGYGGPGLDRGGGNLPYHHPIPASATTR